MKKIIAICVAVVSFCGAVPLGHGVTSVVAAGGCTITWEAEVGVWVAYPPLSGGAGFGVHNACSYVTGGGLVALNCSAACQLSNGTTCPTACSITVPGGAPCSVLTLTMLAPGNGSVADLTGTAICGGVLGSVTTSTSQTSALGEPRSS